MVTKENMCRQWQGYVCHASDGHHDHCTYYAKSETHPWRCKWRVVDTGSCASSLARQFAPDDDRIMTKVHWISVEDRLPEVGQRVLIVYTDSRISLSRVAIDLRVYEDNGVVVRWWHILQEVRNGRVAGSADGFKPPYNVEHLTTANTSQGCRLVCAHTTWAGTAIHALITMVAGVCRRRQRTPLFTVRQKAQMSRAMNKTKIEWCGRTWNPVTGCHHGCGYCYARRIAERFAAKQPQHDCTQPLDARLREIRYGRSEDGFKYGFTPTLHSWRLAQPGFMKKPQDIFVCSMADLFGDWVPDEWIDSVIDSCLRASQHRYLFLTKNPKRYHDFLFLENEIFWLGTSVTTQKDLANWADVFEANQYNRHHERLFLSIEPMLEPISNLAPILKPLREWAARCPQSPEWKDLGWVIIGAESGNRKNKVVPKREWIEEIVTVCRDFGIPVFLKNSLAKVWGEPLIQEFPWEGVA